MSDKLQLEIEALIKESLRAEFMKERCDIKLIQIIDTSELPAQIAERILKKWKSTQNLD